VELQIDVSFPGGTMTDRTTVLDPTDVEEGVINFNSVKSAVFDPQHLTMEELEHKLETATSSFQHIEQHDPKILCLPHEGCGINCPTII
jgi:hypothetical protein